VGLEEAEARSFLGDDKEHSAHDAACLMASSNGQKVPFSQDGLAIPERDKLQMKVKSRTSVSYSWEQTLRIVEQLKSIDSLGQARREKYSTLFLLAAASGLRIGELLALRADDIGKNTIRVDESFGPRRCNWTMQERCSVQNSRPC
jgi:integrase